MTTSRIEKIFNQGQAFVGFVTAGDGGIEKTLAVAMAQIEGGVNILEIGVPFSDPVADGPVIQRASERALQASTTLEDVFQLIKTLRQKTDIPIIIYSYLNVVLADYQKGTLIKKALAAGADGFLIVDFPLEENAHFQAACAKENLAFIQLLSPSTPIERVKKIAKAANGFLYYACRKGTTGVRAGLPPDLSAKMKMIRKHVDLPVVIGFGISTREMAADVLKRADGFVVASLFLKALEEGATPPELKKIVQNLNPMRSL